MYQGCFVLLLQVAAINDVTSFKNKPQVKMKTKCLRFYELYAWLCFKNATSSTEDESLASASTTRITASPNLASVRDPAEGGVEI